MKEKTKKGINPLIVSLLTILVIILCIESYVLVVNKNNIKIFNKPNEITNDKENTKVESKQLEFKSSNCINCKDEYTFTVESSTFNQFKVSISEDNGVIVSYDWKDLAADKGLNPTEVESAPFTSKIETNSKIISSYETGYGLDTTGHVLLLLTSTNEVEYINLFDSISNTQMGNEIKFSTQKLNNVKDIVRITAGTVDFNNGFSRNHTALLFRSDGSFYDLNSIMNK